MKRFGRVALAALAVGLALPATEALAQAYPTRPVRMIVPFPPGGATDIIARLVSDRLTELWGQTVIVDYKPGAGTVVGTEVVAEAIKVLTAVAPAADLDIQTTEYDLGARRYNTTGELLPDAVVEELRGYDAILLGAIGDRSEEHTSELQSH